METVTVDGVTYTKASLLAKRFRYTSDYIGQLCRGGKVKCELVGRSWYVSELSLLKHKDQRYKSIRESDITIKIKAESANNTETVHPRILKNALRYTPVSTTSTQKNTPLTSVKYLHDDASLLPQPTKTPTVERESVSLNHSRILPRIPVRDPDALQVKVAVQHKAIEKISFTELPTVALRGSVSITPIEQYAVAPEVKNPVVLEALVASPIVPDLLPVPDIATVPAVVVSVPSSPVPVLLVAILTASLLAGFLVFTEERYHIVGQSAAVTLGITFSLDFDPGSY